MVGRRLWEEKLCLPDDGGGGDGRVTTVRKAVEPTRIYEHKDHARTDGTGQNINTYPLRVINISCIVHFVVCIGIGGCSIAYHILPVYCMIAYSFLRVSFVLSSDGTSSHRHLGIFSSAAYS